MTTRTRGEPHDEHEQGDLFGARGPAAPASAAMPAVHDDPANQSALPYRLTPRSCTPQELARRNAEERRRGVSLFEPDAAHTVRHAKSAVLARLEAWVHHPDEHVPLELITKPYNDKVWDADRKETECLRDMLYQRAVHDADAEGIIWSPLLDALADKRRWVKPVHPDPENAPPPREGTVRVNFGDGIERSLPTPALPAWRRESPVRDSFYDDQRGEGYDYARSRWAHIGPYAATPAPFEFAADRAARLTPWIAAQTDPERVRPLLTCEYAFVPHLVAAHTRCLSPAFVDELLEHDDAGVARMLACNAALTPAAADQMFAWAVERMAQPARRYTSDTADRARGLWRALQEEGHRPSPPQIAALDASIPVTPTPAKKQAKDEFVRPGAQRAALKALLAPATPLTAENLLHLLPRIAGEDDQLIEVLKHPAATPAVWREIVQRSGAFAVRRALAAIPEARRDPELRRVLARSSSADVLAALCADAPPEEFRTLMRRLFAAQHYRKGHEILTDRKAPALAALTPEDFEVLLANDRLKILDEAEAIAAVRHLHLNIDDRTPGHVPAGEAFARKHFPRFIREAITNNPDTAPSVISHWDHELATLLTRADVLPIVTVSKPKQRIAMLRAVRPLPLPAALPDGPWIEPPPPGGGQTFFAQHFPQALRDCLADEPWTAETLLPELTPEELAVLTADDLQPFFEMEEQATKLAALEALAHVQASLSAAFHPAGRSTAATGPKARIASRR